MTTLLVANDGGHLDELKILLARIDVQEPFVWCTVPSAHSHALLAGEDVRWMRYARTHDLAVGLVNTTKASQVLSQVKPSLVLSTGSALAVSFLPLASTMGVPCHYIESATRVTGPSLAGRLVAAHPRVRVYTQHHAWAGKRWKPTTSVFDAFTVEPTAPPPSLRSVVVSVGTSKEYGFRRLVETVARLLPADCEIVWQTGITRVDDLPISARVSIPADELADLMAQADAVITHAGIGSILTALQAGKVPIVVPRRAAYHEHVDDHQVEIANSLEVRDELVVVKEPSDLTYEDIRGTAGLRVLKNDSALPITLQ